MKSLPKVRLPRPRQMSAAEERLVRLNESTLNENFDRIAIELNSIDTSGGGEGGGGTETQADWNEADPTSPAYIQNKPTSMTPTAHNHGRIDSNGRTGSDYAHASGDKLMLADASDMGRIIRSDIALGSATNKWLNESGAWSTPTYTDVGAMAAGATPTPAAHASSHAAGAADELTPSDIGAMAVGDAPTAHAASHKTGGTDPLTPSDIGAMAANATPTPAAHHATHEAGGSDEIQLPAATTSAAGIVQLYDGVDSTSTTMAATAAAVKAAYEHSGGGGTPSAMSVTWVTNLNNAYTENDNELTFYSFSDTATNGPGYAGFCVYYSYSYPRAVQYAFAVSSAKISRRGRATNGTWGSWTHIT